MTGKRFGWAALLAGVWLVTAAPAPAGETTFAATATAIALDAGPVTQPLVAETPQAALAALGSAARVTLVLSGIRAAAPSGTTYNVFVGLPEGASGIGAADSHYAGTFGLFNLPAAAESGGATVVFDVGALVQDLERSGALAQPLSVTIVPVGGRPGPLVIGRVALSDG